MQIRRANPQLTRVVQRVEAARVLLPGAGSSLGVVGRDLDLAVDHAEEEGVDTVFRAAQRGWSEVWEDGPAGRGASGLDHASPLSPPPLHRAHINLHETSALSHLAV